MARRVKIRRTPRHRGTLTAAGQKITDPSKTFKSSMGSSGSDWQEQAWTFLDKVGELRYYVGWRAASVARCQLVGSDLDPDTGRPTGYTENPTVRKIVRDIAGGVTGQSQILKRLATALTVPGEGFVSMIVRDSESVETYSDGSPLSVEDQEQGEFQEWIVLSRDEIKASGSDGLEFTLEDDSKHLFDEDRDLLFRVWNPHPRKASEADSPVRAAEDSLLEIVRTTKSIDNAAKSRLVGNGILFVPQEMSLPSQASPGATPMAGDPAGPDYGIQPDSVQQLQDLLYQVGTTAYKDQESMAAFMPIIASVPGEWTDKVEHVTFDSAVAETSLKTREAAIRRLAMSLDVAPERLLGLGANSNHWSAWAIAEDDVKVHVVPVLETIVASLTQFILRPLLEREGVDPNQHVIWYDTTPLTQDPDKKAEAAVAHDRGGLTTKALRKYSGFDDSDGYDLTTTEGWQELARDKAAADVSLIPALAPLLGGVANQITPPAQQPAINAPTDTTPTESETLPESEPASQPDSTDEPPTETVTSAAVIAFVETFTARALELANKRRRNRANAAQFRGIPMHLAHRNLPAVPATDVPKLIEGWDASVPWGAVERLGFTRRAIAAWVERDAADELMKVAG
ncbi:hypothetical protein LRS71_09385 [Rhodococcus pyridinivorans]|uniref:hypothetical protein n=1 Tax=Rhodococcus pyridinivorans TaxID=103816 RepID=UPI001E358B3E|nr:hypothetical protein [Rhodococcus pyridinivorans]MCD5419765.1 hypothetical protein [Rhodococcus pyridinivorans]